MKGLAWLVVLGAALVASCEGASGVKRTSAGAALDVASQLRAAYVAARQAEGDADPAYALARFAGTSAGGMRAELGAQGLTLAKEGWRVTLGAARVCGTPPERAAEISAGESANRAVLAGRVRGIRLDERYANGPLGMEQEWVLGADPCGGQLEIDVAVAGLAPALRADGKGVELRDASGTARVGYTDLFARDADGRALPAEMTVEAGTIVLRVDTGGARFPVVVDPLAWVHGPELVAGDGAAQDQLGFSVSLSGSTALAGAPGKAIGSNVSQGAAYVFVRAGNTWVQQAKLVASDGGAHDSFGLSVSLSGSTALVGAFGRNGRQGAAYVFAQSGSTWSQQAKLVAGDGAADDGFGESVFVSGSTAVIGAQSKTVGANANQGAAYVFVQSGSAWTQQAKLTASDGAAGDAFGSSVALSGSTAVVGAYGANAFQGAAYVFVQSGSTWTQQAKIVANDGAASDTFGASVSIAGSTAVVGANSARSSHGAAYVFAQSGTTWTQQAELVASDGAAQDAFGSSVSLSGTTLLVGASNKTVASNMGQGAAYFFTQSGGTWTQQAEVVASDGFTLDAFGFSVSLSGSAALIGASGHTVGIITNAGAAYVEGYGLTNGSACTVAADCGSGSCVDGVCCDTPCTALCQACTAALKESGADGTCGPVKAGTNPHADPCAVSPVSTCGTDGKCNGAGYCELYAFGTACGTTCVGNVATPGTCNGAGTCRPGMGKSCAPNVCAGGVCEASCTTSADCDPSAWCNAGRCVPRAMLGQPCASTDVCAGDAVCVDGVCCNSACAGQCEACDVPGSAGTCTPVTGAPHGTRAACAGTGTACGGTCGPASTSACQYPGTSTSCGGACANATQTESTCNGAGACVAHAPTACPGGYACNGAKCNTSCTQDGDCIAPNVCGATGACAAPPPSGGTASSGGGCSTTPTRATGGAAAAALLVLAAFARGARRRRPRPSLRSG